jgi:hypothetical protein
MPVEIRETKVTPAASGSVVQLYISDAPPDDESTTLFFAFLRNCQLIKLLCWLSCSAPL